MTAAVIGVASGFMLGALLMSVLFRLRTRRRTVICPDPAAHELSPTDHDAVSAEFAAHTASVRRALSRYADELADGDVRLREQLRRLEVEV